MCSIKVGYANALSLGQIAAKKKERGHFEWAQNEPKLGRNKDEGDTSLSFLAFWGDVLNIVFLKYSKESISSSSHAGIPNVPSDVCYYDTTH